MFETMKIEEFIMDKKLSDITLDDIVQFLQNFYIEYNNNKSTGHR